MSWKVIMGLPRLYVGRNQGPPGKLETVNSNGAIAIKSDQSTGFGRNIF